MVGSTGGIQTSTHKYSNLEVPPKDFVAFFGRMDLMGEIQGRDGKGVVIVWDYLSARMKVEERRHQNAGRRIMRLFTPQRSHGFLRICDGTHRLRWK